MEETMPFIEWVKTIPLIGKFAKFLFKLFNLEKENRSLKTEINVLRQKINEFEELHKNPLEFDPGTGTWFGTRDGNYYCAKCKAHNRVSPMKNIVDGLECPACNEKFLFS